MIRGHDKGADIRMARKGKSVGIVQCKRTDRALSAAVVIAEIAKFLLWAEVKPGACRRPIALYLLARLGARPRQQDRGIVRLRDARYRRIDATMDRI